MKKFILVDKKPNVVELSDGKEVFGEAEEIISRDDGAERAKVTKVTLKGPNILHTHQEAEEMYICLQGEGELFLDGKIIDFVPEMRAIIPPGTLHSARPKNKTDSLVLLSIASPASGPEDHCNDPRGRKW